MLWMLSCRSMGTSFSTENWLHWIRKGDLHFSSCKIFFPVASDLFLRLLFTESKWRAARESSFFPPSRVAGEPACGPQGIRYSFLRYYRRLRVKFLRRFASSAWKALWANGSIIASVANITEVSLSERKPTRIQGESTFFSFHRF